MILKILTFLKDCVSRYQQNTYFLRSNRYFVLENMILSTYMYKLFYTLFYHYLCCSKFHRRMLLLLLLYYYYFFFFLYSSSYLFVNLKIILPRPRLLFIVIVVTICDFIEFCNTYLYYMYDVKVHKYLNILYAFFLR